MNSQGVRIGLASARLGVCAGLLRRLEAEGRVPIPRRDSYGHRVYGEDDLKLLRDLGVGRRPSRYKALDEVLDATR